MKILHDSFRGGVKLRSFMIADIKQLYKWQSLSDMRKYFRNSATPSWQEHLTWCENTMNCDHEALYIIENDGCSVGFLRLSKIESSVAYEVSILLAPESRGKAIASTALQIVKDNLEGETVRAFIHPENIRSIKLFTTLGFEQDKNQAGWYQLRS
jgi:UDP-2,4-diacetamido-2,4,6-trideoxy-beta-L-altropyranose hydrolase